MSAADRQEEGWAVRARPAVLGAVLVPFLLLVLLVGAGIIYRHTLRDDVLVRMRPVHVGPRLEVSRTPPTDPPQRRRTPAARDPAVAHAMAAVVRRGDAALRGGGR